MSDSLYCSWCKKEMAYIHGHAACVSSGCAMFGLTQAECCSGEPVKFCEGTLHNEIALSPQRLQ